MNKILIIDTGGTFDKQYVEHDGSLVVDTSGDAAKKIVSLARGNLDATILPIIHKDSNYFDDSDRELLLQTVQNATQNQIIIIHGTDTMDKSAAFLASRSVQKTVVFVGSMKPYSIEKDEAIFNFASAVGFLRANPSSGIYISMHSLVLPHDKIYKDREAGVFRPLK